MKAGLLVCDHVKEEFRSTHGSYPDMFRAFLPELDFDNFYVCDGDFPRNVEDYEAWMMTGSRFSVYDEVDWIFWLKAFVRDIYEAEKAFVGVCFGHQMLAQALGGKVEKAETGWSVGVHEFEMLEQKAWMQPFQNKLNLLMSCQDQVQILPENSQVLARTSLCPIAMFQVGEKMFGIQGHPEFSKAYNQALMESRAERISQETVAKAVESLKQPVHPELVAEWILNFLADKTHPNHDAI